MSFLRASATEPDYDGLVSGFKAPLDGIVKAGILVDDKASNLIPIYQWKKEKPRRGYIQISIEEVGNGSIKRNG